ncbi:hypothetical protein JYP52_21095 [Nitratireductor aquibiodomus]|uniref:hypothetical protein n=1 Tax=Nitratireductor aquibiodomus TaxID=204799 RepID=UPI0019D3A5DF|nr:hypothetical protein [Nitratireductor aquibiodomus]MBN7763640.1 hypothetical protein [Nitratireductor aquibiodomus]
MDANTEVDTATHVVPATPGVWAISTDGKKRIPIVAWVFEEDDCWAVIPGQGQARPAAIELPDGTIYDVDFKKTFSPGSTPAVDRWVPWRKQAREEKLLEIARIRAARRTIKQEGEAE